MLKKTITYTDYNGTERTEDFYFNLSQAELVELEFSVSGGWSELASKMVKEQNIPELIKIFKEMIVKSYGEKSLDGRQFIKSEEISNNFLQTEAYSVLLMELLQGGEKAVSDFFNGVMPSIPENLSAANQTPSAVNT